MSMVDRIRAHREAHAALTKAERAAEAAARALVAGFTRDGVLVDKAPPVVRVLADALVAIDKARAVESETERVAAGWVPSEVRSVASQVAPEHVATGIPTGPVDNPEGPG